MGKRICATCDWYSRETMSCKNENSIICTTGEGGSRPHWENYELEFWGKEVQYSSGTELKFCPCCGRELEGEER